MGSLGERANDGISRDVFRDKVVSPMSEVLAIRLILSFYAIDLSVFSIEAAKD